MNYYNIQIVLQEVPHEISICFSVCGCTIRCHGCHSPHLWKENNGYLLTPRIYRETLDRYKGLATCVLFMGGEWHKENLIYFLNYALEQGYQTCLYSGEDKIDPQILKYLTWIKTGRWDAELGGLHSPNTNQRFVEVQSNTLLNHLFIKDHSS